MHAVIAAGREKASEDKQGEQQDRPKKRPAGRPAKAAKRQPPAAACDAAEGAKDAAQGKAQAELPPTPTTPATCSRAPAETPLRQPAAAGRRRSKAASSPQAAGQLISVYSSAKSHHTSEAARRPKFASAGDSRNTYFEQWSLRVFVGHRATRWLTFLGGGRPFAPKPLEQLLLAGFVLQMLVQGAAKQRAPLTP